MISLNLRIKTLPATAWGLGITYPQSIKRLGQFLTADCKSAGTPNGGKDISGATGSNSCDYLPQAISSLPIIYRTVFLENAPAAT